MAKKQIDESLYDAVLYLHILHTAGASQYEAVQSLTKYADIFGAAAKEFAKAISDTELCGCTLYEGLMRVAETTPSKKLAQFAAGYAAAVRTAGTAFPFLDDAEERLRIEEELAEKRYQESLSVMAEVYLTLFVAAPLFAVIAGLVLGMVADVNPFYLEMLLYLLFPAASAAFLLVLDSMGRQKTRFKPLTIPQDFTPYAKREGDSSEKQEFIRLRQYDRKQKREAIFRHPVQFFTDNPEMILFISTPAGFLLSLTMQSLFLQAGIILLTAGVPFSLFYERKQRKERAAESALPDFCRILGGAVARGMTTAGAVGLAAKEKSVLQNEVQKTADAISMGELANTALFRLANRLRISAAGRIVVLIAESSRFTPHVSPALFVLAEESRRLELADSARRSGMSLYTAVIYLAFFVYLFVAGILLVVFLEAAAAAGTVDAQTYETILLSGCLIHAVCSGFAAGKMGEGRLAAGVKHVLVMTALWMVFALIFSG